MNVTKGPLVRQLRRESLKFTYGPRNELKAHDHTLPWSQKYDREQELRASMSTAEDEHVEALFGVDSIPWVHPVCDVGCTTHTHARTHARTCRSRKPT